MHATLPCLVIAGDTIPVHPHPALEWTLPTADVARGFGVSANAIQKHKERRPDELVEGKHWLQTICPKGCDTLSEAPGPTTPIHWTRRGVIRLGFFLHSPRAKLFRDAAEDLVLAATQGELAPVANLPALVRAEVRRQLGHPCGRGDGTLSLSKGLSNGQPSLPTLALLALLADLPAPALRLYRELLSQPSPARLSCPHQGRRGYGLALRALADRRLVAVPDPGHYTRRAYTVHLLPIPDSSGLQALSQPKGLQALSQPNGQAPVPALPSAPL